MPKSNRLLVTGGAGFIGSALIRFLINETSYNVVNIDKLTYAGNLQSLEEISDNKRYVFEHVDITNTREIVRIFNQYEPCGIFHLAAESHVDRSISEPEQFMHTNIIGTYNLLNCALKYYLSNKLNPSDFRFIHVSTDEVFGSLGNEGYFSETTAYDPRSPYSATKASSDFIAKAWYHTYNLPVIVTNCTNNYGPFHFPEKLIPLIINNAIQLKNLPIYGSGNNIRDWLYVDDHVRALFLVLERGIIGETYCIGGHNERTNLQVVKTICSILDKLKPRSDGESYNSQIVYVADRAGHDFRYAMNASKLQQLGWIAMETFESGIKKTIGWYLNNQEWVLNVQNGEYKNWIDSHYKKGL